MRTGRRDRHRGMRGLGVAVVALSLLHTPLPLPDYHNVRHHDGPGEVCAHHDHLLRWHPGAALASDVAVLHWHWFLPMNSDDACPEGSGLSMHAHLHDWSAPPWEGGPQVAEGSRARPEPSPRLAAGLPVAQAWLLYLEAPGAPTRTSSPGLLPHGALLARGGSLAALLHRWLC